MSSRMPAQRRKRKEPMKQVKMVSLIFSFLHCLRASSCACSASHRAMLTPIASISTKNAGGVPLCGCWLHAPEHQRARGTVRQMRTLHS